MSVDSRLNLSLPALESSSLNALRALEQPRPDTPAADAPASDDASPSRETIGSNNVLAALAWGTDGIKLLDSSAYLPSGASPVEDLEHVDALVSALGLS